MVLDLETKAQAPDAEIVKATALPTTKRAMSDLVQDGVTGTTA